MVSLLQSGTAASSKKSGTLPLSHHITTCVVFVAAFLSGIHVEGVSA